MSVALTAQPGLHSTATAVSTKVKVKGRNRKRKKSTMAGGACATGAVYGTKDLSEGDIIQWEREYVVVESLVM